MTYRIVAHIVADDGRISMPVTCQAHDTEHRAKHALARLFGGCETDTPAFCAYPPCSAEFYPDEDNTQSTVICGECAGEFHRRSCFAEHIKDRDTPACGYLCPNPKLAADYRFITLDKKLD